MPLPQEAPLYSPAYSRLSSVDLRRKLWLFGLMNQGRIVQVLGDLANLALRWGLPIQGLVRATIFRQFCGGENLHQCTRTIEELASTSIGSIPDYSVEGQDSEQAMDRCLQTLLEGLAFAARNPHTPLFVFKVSGLVSSAALHQLAEGRPLNTEVQEQAKRGRERVNTLLQKAHELQCPIMVDAEESWIQDPIDRLTMEMMAEFNKQKAVVFNTIQLYRHDRLHFLRISHQIAEAQGFILGLKLVRGAYMEKERAVALEKNRQSPIQISKEATDTDYDEAVRFCMDHIHSTAVIIASHNEQSNLLGAKLLDEMMLPHNHPHVHFSQLYGMSDTITFNLAKEGFNVSKYLPFGPIQDVIPYLMRRAQENTSVSGQTGRELLQLKRELARRKSL